MSIIISKHLADSLVCPNCRIFINSNGNILECNICGSIFPVKNGVVDFMPSSITPESPFYNDNEYKEGIKKLHSLHKLHYNKKSLSGKFEFYLKKELLKIVINPVRPFVDIGCGMGSSFDLLGYPNEIVGIDNSFELLKLSKETFPNSDCILCDILKSPFVDESFNTIFCIGTLEHIYYLESFTQSINKMLKKDGFLYVLIPTEGGLAWGFMRNLAHLKYSKIFNINYKKIAEKEHCNKIVTIENVIQKYFIIDFVRSIPWRIGGNNINLSKIYRLRKMI